VSAGEPLPELVDRKQLSVEMGVGRAAIDGIFRALPVTTIPGVRKVYVRRADVAALLEANTYSGDRVRK
jgi:hypothetical protein